MTAEFNINGYTRYEIKGGLAKVMHMAAYRKQYYRDNREQLLVKEKGIP